MENYAHQEKNQDCCGLHKRMKGRRGKCCFEAKNKKNNWGKVQNCPQNIHNLKKLQWKKKKFVKKLWGYIVNKAESYQHFVCG